MPPPPRRRPPAKRSAGPQKTLSGRLDKRRVTLPDGRYLLLYTPAARPLSD